MRIADYMDRLDSFGFMLNEPQQAAVRHGLGPMLVVAGPGSGKTRVITARVGALLASGVDPGGIMVVTFTRAAAGEMKKRIAELPGVTSEQLARLKIGTFHSQFWRILKRHGVTVNVADERTRRGWIIGVLRALGEEVKDDLVENLLSSISYGKNNLSGPDDLDKGEELLREVWVAYEEQKQHAELIDYDDMLVKTYELLQINGQALQELQCQVRYLLVDEFQDTNKAQYEVLRLLAAPENNLFVVGDVDQAIYAWRAARPEFLLQFTEHYPHAQRSLLSANYRSTPQIISLANRVIARNKIRYEKHSEPVRTGGEMPVLLTPANEREEAKTVLTMVKKQMEAGVLLHDLAVFYRVNRYNHHLINLLVEDNVPFVVRDRERALEDHWAVREALAFLRLAVDNDHVDSFALVGRRTLGLSEEQMGHIRAAVRRGQSMWDGAARIIIRQKVSELQQALRSVARQTPAQALDYYLWDLGFTSYLQWYARKRGLPTDEFTSMCEDLRAEMVDYKDIASYLEYIDKLDSVMQQSKREEAQLGSLNLMTLHGAKGLEFSAVWIMGCIEGILPHARAISPREREEERRLFYVGCTRAADILTVLAPKEYRGKKTEVSPFVIEAFLDHVQKPAPDTVAAGQPTVGMKVVHSALGAGTVVSCSGGPGAMTFATVEFASGSRKMQWELSLKLGTLCFAEKNTSPV